MAAMFVPRWGLRGRGSARPRRASRGLTADHYEALERRRVIWMSLIGLAASFGLAQAVINIGPAAVVIPAALLLTAAVIWQPRIGLYAVVTMVLLFEVISADPL